MTDFLQYVVNQVKSKNLSKYDAINLLRQFEESSSSNGNNFLHPLVHKNTSRLNEQRFSSVFNSRKITLESYTVNGQKILPGVICLEMVREAIMRALDTTGNNSQPRIGFIVENVVWGNLLAIHEKDVTVHISVIPGDYLSVEGAAQINVEIYSEPQKGEVAVYNQCQIMSGSSEKNQLALDLDGLHKVCVEQVTGSSLYAELRGIGINYTTTYQSIEDIFIGNDRALAKLSLPEITSDTVNSYVLHPSILEGGVQAAIFLCLQKVDGMSADPVFPYSLESLKLYHSCVADMWVSVLCIEKKKFDGTCRVDVDLCDETGRLCVQLKGLVLRKWEGSTGGSKEGVAKPSVAESERSLLMVQPCWSEKSVSAITAEQAQPWGEYHLIFCELDKTLKTKITGLLTSQIGGVKCLNLCSEDTAIDARYSNYAQAIFERLQTIVRDKPKAGVLIQLLITGQTVHHSESSLFAGLFGLLQSAAQENPRLVGQMIEIDGDDLSAEGVVEFLLENHALRSPQHCRYRKGRREVCEWRDSDFAQPSAQLPWKEDGVYLITGGAGGLGLLFASEASRRVKGIRLILTGRSALSDEKTKRLSQLREQCGEVEYRRVDITDWSAVKALLDDIGARYGALNGIIHSAGVIRDNFILRKTPEELSAVLAPKVTGLVNLDLASRAMNLEFFVTFSSITGVFGNAGQADYAAANAFMDHYVRYRNRLVGAGQGHGRTLSINWPLWKSGAMHIDVQSELLMEQNTGMAAMASEAGLQAFYQVLSLGGDQWVVMEGNVARMREWLLRGQNTVSSTEVAIEKLKANSAIDSERLREKSLQRIKNLFSDVVKLDKNKIDVDEPLESYGIDSIMITHLNRQLGGVFGDLSKTLFYEYQTLAELTEYFLAEHTSTCIQWSGLTNGEGTVAPQPPALPKQTLKTNGFPVLASLKTQFNKFKLSKRVSAQPQREPIAIIGMSGRYPQANNLEEYWKNLMAGKDCISEIPAERWPLEGFFVEDMQMAVEGGKSYSKWGGFIDNFSTFDSLFFNIPPREAINIDPQERIFLQCCWHAVEDAGYTRKRLAKQYGGRVGVFVGITKTGFDLYGPSLWGKGEKIYPHTSFSSVANRFSYFMNLHGPSMPIDTMCSSSLTAIHEACEHLYRGECDISIAGGVNLYLHPSTYIGLCSLQMLSVDGRCRSFGLGGNGFVPGEGVGVVILKSLSAAESDCDHIYALVRGTSINHGGKTNGYTVPNPVAQGKVIRDAIKKAGINAREISYIEAHGTGTQLGDPIEVSGLSQAFKEDTLDRQYCAIGSAKSNIGHLEAAAGMAGLEKIVLQMKNKKLVPSLHVESLNENIDFKNSPFFVQRKLFEWNRPEIVDKNGEKKYIPRVAGLSSFGAGGANAHIIIEEYSSERFNSKVSGKNSVIIVLSAKNKKNLFSYAANLLDYSLNNPQLNLVDLSYTLQIGREEMDERLAMVVKSVDSIVGKLKKFIGGDKNIEDLYVGSNKKNENLKTIVSDVEFQVIVKKWIELADWTKLIDLWMKGVDVNWGLLYENEKPSIISAPVYPFEGEKIWIPETDRAVSESDFFEKDVNSHLHPFVHKNTSTLWRQSFESYFNFSDSLTKVIIDPKGSRVSPGFFLEMIRFSLLTSLGGESAALDEYERGRIEISNIEWINSVRTEGDGIWLAVEVWWEELETLENKNTLLFDLYEFKESGNDRLTCCRGSGRLKGSESHAKLDINRIVSNICDSSDIDGCNVSGVAEKVAGVERDELVEKLYFSADSILVHLSDFLLRSMENVVFHPKIFSLIKTVLFEFFGCKFNGFSSDVSLFDNFIKVEKIDFVLKENKYKWIYIGDINIFNSFENCFLDVYVCDENGFICINMQVSLGFPKSGKKIKINNFPLLLTPCWSASNAKESPMDYTKHYVVILGEVENSNIENDLAKTVEESFFGVNCVYIDFRNNNFDNVGSFYTDCSLRVFELIKECMIKIDKDKMLFQLIYNSSDWGDSLAGLVGLFSSAREEHSRFIPQIIQIENSKKFYNAENLVASLREAMLFSSEVYLKFSERETKIRVWKELNAENSIDCMPWKEGEAYLITGGAGGLGIHCAKEIAQKLQRGTIILSGRSASASTKLKSLEELCREEVEILYRQVDVTSAESVGDMINGLREANISLKGVIHCAGLIQVNLIVNKSIDEVKRILAPKVHGAVNLDLATKDLDLDFMIFYSSIAGYLGNDGLSDYAMANAFMDSYAARRNSLVEAGKRHGKTLAVNWPQWVESGMQGDAETVETLSHTIGVTPIETATAFKALYAGLVSGVNNVLVLPGNRKKIKKKVLKIDRKESSKVQSVEIESKSLSLDSLLEPDVIGLVVEVLGAGEEDVDVDIDLNTYGFDSILFARLTNQLNRRYGLELKPTVMFECRTLSELVRKIIDINYTEIYRYFNERKMLGIAVDVSGEDFGVQNMSVSADISSLINFSDQLADVLSREMAGILGVEVDVIDVNKELNEYGFDSILMAKYANSLNREFGLGLKPTLLFEYRTVSDLVGHLEVNYNEELKRYFGKTEIKAKVHERSTDEIQKKIVKYTDFKKVDRFRKVNKDSQGDGLSQKVAVIGMSGKFPMAKDVKEFWQNLQEEKDCIVEIPKERWVWEDIYGDPDEDGNMCNIKWGGFIDGVDEFDPQFFNISPAEARSMDPQQRLLMMHIWKTIEDAGYSAKSLAGSNTGIFMAAGNSGYGNLLIDGNRKIEGYFTSSITPSVGPNRMSYFLDFHGPSEPIETACSSSLVAMHRALISIKTGGCDMALVGGVNILLGAEGHISLSRAGMLCEDGRCKSFSDKANGFVRSEGVGVVMLKKLSVAENDRDNIYGVILSSAENHGGRSSSFTAPNPKSQTELIKTAYRQANVSIDSVGYIEAQGAGTQLGDPIEIEAFKKAFSDLNTSSSKKRINNEMNKSWCGIGAVKSNIGHSEIASGMAGFIKVLLQIKHKRLVKSLHCESLNPLIDIESSPFYILQSSKPWEAFCDSNGNPLPRRASVNSFGAGGVNAHVLIEEYIPEKEKIISEKVSGVKGYIIVLSAKNEEGLACYIKNIYEDLIRKSYSERNIEEISYTLQVGRVPMEARLAILVSSLDDLKNKLKSMIKNIKTDNFYMGNVTKYKDTIAALSLDGDIHLVVNSWIEKGQYIKIMKYWVKGLEVNWLKFYGKKLPRRVSLPGYPFSKKRYWVETKEKKPVDIGIVKSEKETFYKNKNKNMENESIVDNLTNILAELVGLKVEDISKDMHFYGLGIDSLILQSFIRKIEKIYGVKISPRKILEELNSVNFLANHIKSYHSSAGEKPTISESDSTAVNEGSGNYKLEIKKTISEITELELNEIGSDTHFYGLGMDSIILQSLGKVIEKKYKVSVSPLNLLEKYYNVDLLSKFVEDSFSVPENNGEKIFPVSYIQKMISRLMSLSPLGNPFNMYYAMTLQGPLDIEGLEACIQYLINRHEALRIRLVKEGGEFIVKVPERDDFKLSIIKNRNEAEKSNRSTVHLIDREIIKFLSSSINEPFDLSKNKPIRACVYPRSVESNILLIEVHHFVSDAWSMNIFKSELSDLYESHCRNIEEKLPKVDIQYSDYIKIQERNHQTPALKKQLAYWRKSLSKFSNDCMLPTEVPRNDNKDFTMSMKEVAVNNELYSSLLEYCSRKKMSPFVLFMSAIHLACYSCSDLRKVVVSTPMADRKSSDTERTMGPLFNFLPIASVLEKEVTIGNFVVDVEKTIQEAKNNMDICIEKIIEDDEIALTERELVAGLHLNYMSFPNEEQWNFYGVKRMPIPLHIKDTWIEVGMLITKIPMGVEINVVYLAALYSEKYIELMCRKFVEALECIVSNSEENVLTFIGKERQ